MKLLISFVNRTKKDKAAIGLTISELPFKYTQVEATLDNLEGEARIREHQEIKKKSETGRAKRGKR